MEKTPSLLRLPVLDAFMEIRRRFSAAAAALVTPSRPVRAVPAPLPSCPAAAAQIPCPKPPSASAAELMRKGAEYSHKTWEYVSRHGLEAVAREWAREIAPVRDAEARIDTVARHPVVKRAMSFYTAQDDLHVRFALLYCAMCDVPLKEFQLDPDSLAARPARVAEANRRRFARAVIMPATGENQERDEKMDPFGEMIRAYDSAFQERAASARA